MKKNLAWIILDLLFIILIIMLIMAVKSALYILLAFFAIAISLMNLIKVLVSSKLCERYEELYENVRKHKELPERYWNEYLKLQEYRKKVKIIIRKDYDENIEMYSKTIEKIVIKYKIKYEKCYIEVR